MNYETVPEVFTGKDLNYLCDMFHWHYGAFKKTINRIDNVEDEEIRELMEKSSDIFYNHMEIVLDILREGGSNE
jgi:hypothetical protein